VVSLFLEQDPMLVNKLSNTRLHPEEGRKVYLCSHDLTGFELQAPSLLHRDGSLLSFILYLCFGEAKENTDFNNNKKGIKPMSLELQIQVGPTLCGGVVTTLAKVSCMFQQAVPRTDNNAAWFSYGAGLCWDSLMSFSPHLRD